EAATSAGLAVLRQVIAWREASFLPTLASLAVAPGPAGADRLPRIGLLLGADEALAARLFQVTAAEFERRCEQLLILGEAAEEVAQPFLRRGRLPVLLGAEALAALREAAGRAGILAVDAAGFAEAVGRNRPEDAFAQSLGAPELALLLALHATAGAETALADTLARLLRQRRAAPGTGGFQPVQRGWSSPHAAAAVNEHLARLWAAGAGAHG
ncbi:MAG: hypothetical protein B7Z53_04745, partial [Rhodospirillales bacterium 12-71-4]